MTPIWAALLAVVAVVASAVAALIETSFSRVGAGGARALEESDPERAARLEPLLEETDRAIAPVLLLSRILQFGSIAVTAVVAHDRYGPGIAALAVAVEGLVLFVVAEAAPKAHAFSDSLRVAASLAGVAGFVSRIPLFGSSARALFTLGRKLTPSRHEGVVPVVTEEALIAMAEAAADADEIEYEERTLIELVFEFGDTIVREVMAPRPDMVTIPADTTVDGALEAVVTHGFTRLPVTDGGIDDIIGIALSKDLVKLHLSGKGDEPVRLYLRPTHFVPETKRVSELMAEMQSRTFHMAIAVDEYGGTAGLVTLEDVIEELVGEIVDEFDHETPLVETTRDGWRVNGRMPVDELESLISEDLPEGDWDSVGGLLLNLIGHVPESGESVGLGGYRLCAEVVKDRRIDLVLVTRSG